jgi:short-subunit dehydrogenase
VGLFVANAGFGTSGAFLDADPAVEAEMLATNCRALMLGTHHFAGRFARRGRGAIVLVSSILARQGTPWAAHYSATKAYVTALGEALRVEFRERGVEVLVTAPGPTVTGFAARARLSLGKAMPADDVARATLAALGRRGHLWPGGLSKLLVWSMTGLPRAARVRLMGTVMRGMAQG